MGDENCYAAALEEYESGNLDANLKAKAFVLAEGIESRIKIEYIKLRVEQLKGPESGFSLTSWYRSTTSGERGFYLILSIALIFAFGIGLIPLAILVWLANNEDKEILREAALNAPVAHKEQAVTSGAGLQIKQPMHLAAYLCLCLGAWLIGLVFANGLSVLSGDIYSQATAATIVGFWVGKAVLKNKHRDWESVVAFPIINFFAGFLGSVFGQALAAQNQGGVNYSSIMSLVVAFTLSCGIFAISNSVHSR